MRTGTPVLFDSTSGVSDFPDSCGQNLVFDGRSWTNVSTTNASYIGRHYLKEVIFRISPVK